MTDTSGGLSPASASLRSVGTQILPFLGQEGGPVWISN